MPPKHFQTYAGARNARSWPRELAIKFYRVAIPVMVVKDKKPVFPALTKSVQKAMLNSMELKVMSIVRFATFRPSLHLLVSEVHAGIFSM